MGCYSIILYSATIDYALYYVCLRLAFQVGTSFA
jgi:hypothetical protein